MIFNAVGGSGGRGLDGRSGEKLSNLEGSKAQNKSKQFTEDRKNSSNQILPVVRLVLVKFVK